MDVISVLQPENHLASRRRPSSLLSAAAKRQNAVARAQDAAAARTQNAAAFTQYAAGASDRPLSAIGSFPLALVFIASAALFLAPRVESSLGLYRLGRVSFGGDSTLEASMRSLAVPETSAEALASQGAAELPASIKPVSFSAYRVRNGDTVGAILSRSGLKNIGTLLSVNSIDNARRIKVGQTLSIPSMDGILYKAVRGDSLQRIASRYSISVTALLDANDLSSSDIAVGQRVFIPGASLSSMDLRKALGELFVTPVMGRLTSPFGYRSDPFTGVRTFHTGIDIAAPTGTAVKATLDGKIATTGFSSVYGNYVIVTHGEGYQSLYAHLSSVSVKRGQRITQSAVIGRVGNTGYSTGSHLHFSVYKHGKMIDPKSVLK
jgi:LysM repeat protein